MYVIQTCHCIIYFFLNCCETRQNVTPEINFWNVIIVSQRNLKPIMNTCSILVFSLWLSCLLWCPECFHSKSLHDEPAHDFQYSYREKKTLVSTLFFSSGDRE